MVRGVAGRKKRYVGVTTETDTGGTVTPIAIKWKDGRTFPIDYVKDVREAASLKAGGRGIRYLCVVRGKETFLFYEDPLWFVEEKVPELLYPLENNTDIWDE